MFSKVSYWQWRGIQQFGEMWELLKTLVIITAVEIAWSNGITESDNSTISKMMDKIIEEVDWIEVALAWLVCAKNYL